MSGIYNIGHFVIGLWIVRQVVIRSDPRFMSYHSQIKLRVTGLVVNRFLGLFTK